MKKIMFLSLFLSFFMLCSCGGGGKSNGGKVITLNNSTFIEEIGAYDKLDTEGLYFTGDKPAIIDFFATWCGPCKQMTPILSELAEEFADDINIYKVDVDQSYDISQAFGITSMPTFIFIPLDGDMQIVSGYQSKGKFKQMIEEILL